MADVETFHFAILDAIVLIDPLTSTLRGQWNDARQNRFVEPDYHHIVNFALKSVEKLVPVLAWIDRSHLDRDDFFNSIPQSILRAPRVLQCLAKYCQVSENPRPFGSVTGGSAHEATLRYLLELLTLFFAQSEAPIELLTDYLNGVPSCHADNAAEVFDTLSGTLLRSFQCQVRFDRIEGLRRLVHSFNDLSNNRCHLGQPIEFPALLPRGYEDIVGALEAEFLRVLSSERMNEPETTEVAANPQETESVTGECDSTEAADELTRRASRTSFTSVLKAPLDPELCPVRIESKMRKAYVHDQPVVGQLTVEQVCVLNALIAVYPTRLKKDEMERIEKVGDPLGVFSRLIKKSPWSSLLSKAGSGKKGYGWIVDNDEKPPRNHQVTTK